MNKKLVLLILIIAMIALLVGASALYTRLGEQVDTQQLATQQPQPTATSPEATVAAITLAPDFTVYDADGNATTLSQYFGKPIVLNFWASWCGPCQMEMPAFQEKYEELGDSVTFLMVNMTDGGRETQQTAQALLTENGYTFPVLFDLEQDAAYTYRVYSMPTTYFIDALGQPIAQASGPLDIATLQQGIDMITK